jgi:hypothetical protein
VCMTPTTDTPEESGTRSNASAWVFLRPRGRPPRPPACPPAAYS